MLTGTLTRNTKSVCNDLIDLFECNFSLEDVSEYLSEYESLFKRIENRLKSEYGKIISAEVFNRFLLKNRFNNSTVKQLCETKGILDGCLDSIPEESLDNYLLNCFGQKRTLFLPGDYQKIFHMASKTVTAPDGRVEYHPDGVIYETAKEWNDNIWLKLFTIYQSFPSPTQYMQRIVDRLGDQDFKDDSLRMRILKQMLINIDFTETDIDLGDLKKFNNANNSISKKQLEELSESLFDIQNSSGGGISPLSDIKALINAYGDVLSIEDCLNIAVFLECLSEAYREQYKSCNKPILVFLREQLMTSNSGNDIFNTACYTLEEIRNFLKNEIFKCRDYYKSINQTDVVKPVKNKYKTFSNKKSSFDAISYLIKHVDTLPYYREIIQEWNSDTVQTDLITYSELTKRKEGVDKAYSLLSKSKNKKWHIEETNTDDALHFIIHLHESGIAINESVFSEYKTLLEKLRPFCDTITDDNFGSTVKSLAVLRDSLLNDIAQIENNLKIYSDCFKVYVERIDFKYSVSKKLSGCNQTYHNSTRPSSKTNILDCCNYLASGGSADLGPILAKRSLYLFAFAYDMRYYPQNSPYGDPAKDIEKNLFVDFYADNLVHFIDSEAYGYSNEPSGVGINTKNYEECVYLYYINRTDINQREKYKCALDTIKEIKRRENELKGTRTPDNVNINTQLYRSEYVPKLLECKNKEDLIQYILDNYDICRGPGQNSILDIHGESNSLLKAFSKIMDRIKIAQKAEYNISDSDYLKFKEIRNNKNEVSAASLITPWLSINEIEDALNPEMLKSSIINELKNNKAERSKILQLTMENTSSHKNNGFEKIDPDEFNAILDQMIKNFIHLIQACLSRLDKNNLPNIERDISPKNIDIDSSPKTNITVTRTNIIAAYFHYFCQNNLETQKTLSDVYDYFKSYADEYLINAGLQPISSKNLFDILTIVFTYGYINYAIV